jgi:hypothetical protein
MWGRKRKKRGSQLQRQLALGRLEDAMGRVQEFQEEAEDESSVPYPGAVPPSPVPPTRSGLRPSDVPVDNSAAPEPAAEDSDREPQTPLQQDLPAQRRGENSRRRSF